MAPGSSAGGFTLGDSWAKIGAARVFLRRGDVVVGIVPVAAPLVDVVADVVEAEGVGRVAGYGLGSGLPASGVVGERLGRDIVIAPGEIVLLEIGAGGALPFGFSGKTVGAG